MPERVASIRWTLEDQEAKKRARKRRDGRLVAPRELRIPVGHPRIEPPKGAVRLTTEDLPRDRLQEPAAPKCTSLERFRDLFATQDHIQARRDGQDIILDETWRWLEKQGRGEELDKARACLRDSFGLVARCTCCNGRSVVLLGSCSGRACPLCHGRYASERARTYRDRLGPAEYLAYLIVTAPPEAQAGITPRDFTRLARETEASILRWFDPFVPAGVLVVHWSGDESPREMHLHWNLLLSNRAVDSRTGEVVRVKGRVHDLWTLRQLSAAVLDPLGVSPERAQSRYRWRATHADQRHCLRYVCRSQGCGDPLARYKWTLPRMRTMRPVGMLSRGKVSTWRAINGWKSEEQRLRAIGSGDPVESILGSAPEKCGGCGGSMSVSMPTLHQEG